MELWNISSQALKEILVVDNSPLHSHSPSSLWTKVKHSSFLREPALMLLIQKDLIFTFPVIIPGWELWDHGVVILCQQGNESGTFWEDGRKRGKALVAAEGAEMGQLIVVRDVAHGKVKSGSNWLR